MTEITGLTALGAAPANDDQFVIVDVSDTSGAATGTTKKLAASRVARTGASNIFTESQTTQGTGTGFVCRDEAGTTMAEISSLNFVGTRAADVGNNIRGGVVSADRNTNAAVGTVGPAAGSLRLATAAGPFYYYWTDSAGNLRSNLNSAPTGSTGSPTVSDTAGVVVGTQTSWHASKDNIVEWDGAEALDAIRALTLYSYQMIDDGQQTRNGDKPVYKGLVITDEDRESDAWFALGLGEQQIPVLNDRNLFGYMLAAIRHGGDIIEALQTQVAALEARVATLEGA